MRIHESLPVLGVHARCKTLLSLLKVLSWLLHPSTQHSWMHGTRYIPGQEFLGVTQFQNKPSEWEPRTVPWQERDRSPLMHGITNRARHDPPRVVVLRWRMRLNRREISRAGLRSRRQRMGKGTGAVASCLDIEHIAAEIEDDGKGEQHELASNMAVLMAHLLKWKYQADRREARWGKTIKAQRKAISYTLDESPSLKLTLQEPRWLDMDWSRAVAQAASETRLDCFPDACPWAIQEEVLLEAWFPE